LNTQQQALVFTKQGLSEKQGLNLEPITNSGVKQGVNQYFISMCKPDDAIGGETRRQALQAASKEELRLVGTREKHGKQTKYSFSIVTPSGEVVGKPWNFETPLYNPSKNAVKVK
jgi:hypothetical protein